MVRCSNFLAVVFLLLAATTLPAQPFEVYLAELNQAQAGGTGSAATGNAVLCLTQAQDELSMDIQFDNFLTSEITAMHVRIGPPGANGPRVFGLINPQDDVDDFVDLGTGLLSVWDLDDNGVNLQSQINALQSEVLHFLVFTDAFPNGEIRGQIERVIMGDVNQDGVTNLNDVGFFVDLVSSSEYLLEADFDKNGIVDLLDVGPFVAAIAGG